MPQARQPGQRRTAATLGAVEGKPGRLRAIRPGHRRCRGATPTRQGQGQAHIKPVQAQKNERGRPEITDGHHRTAAAIKAGVGKIPVEVAGQ
ncbi:ParB N-terminal domain-containing protein [Massilia sp. UMI-21]|nr:ParB N-terminal domain-containing protein [Massilia sp. UMI-21]